LSGNCHLGEEEIEDAQKRLKTRDLSTVEQAVSCIKKMVSKSLLPSFINWAEKDDSDTERLYALQSGVYDDQIEKFVLRYKVD